MMNWCLIAPSICTSTTTIITVTNISCTEWGITLGPVYSAGSRIAVFVTKAIPTVLVSSVMNPVIDNSISKT